MTQQESLERGELLRAGEQAPFSTNGVGQERVLKESQQLQATTKTNYQCDQTTAVAQS